MLSVQPLAFELIARALVDGDFVGALDTTMAPKMIRATAELYVDNAADDFAQAHGDIAQVSQTIRDEAVDKLVTYAEKILAKVMAAGDDAIRDVIETGEAYWARAY